MSKKISRRNRRIRNLLLVISMMMVVAMASVGVTVAWLTANTTPIVNTFTSSDINITLTETNVDGDSANANAYKMIPGNEIAKDPKVTVKAGSEACYVFVKIDKSANYNEYMEQYVVAEGWTRLNGTGDYGDSEIFYKEQAAAENDVPLQVLAAGDDADKNAGHVQVKTTVTKTQMEAIKTTGMPTLTITAYACQKANVDTAADAWANIANPSGTVTP